MEILQIVFAFIFSIIILVSVHEWGHFQVARWCGVKVLRFSIGFGKSFFSWKDRKGTEFTLSIIPFGGYIKMLDEREGDVIPEEAHLAFNRKSVWKRIAIVAAGPIANFLLAIFALWLMYIIGIKTLIPTIGSIVPNSPAEQAGMKVGETIISIDNKKVKSWMDINLMLATKIGQHTPIFFQTENIHSEKNYEVSIKKWPDDFEKQNLLDVVGIQTWQPKIPPIIGEVLPDSPAFKQGLHKGDKIVAINKIPVHQWRDIANIINKNDQKTLLFSILRNSTTLSFQIKPEKKQLQNKEVYVIGVQAQSYSIPPDKIQTYHYSLISALYSAVHDTWILTVTTASALVKMMTGVISLQNLGGPITIAKIANESLHLGFQSFLHLIALLSVSLGFINLLPIPVLDGGHLLYYGIEAIRGRPLSEKIQNFGVKIGIILIFMATFLAIYNDVLRL